MRKVVFTDLFIACLNEILDYIELDNSLEVASGIEKKVMDMIDLLKTFPGIGLPATSTIFGKDIYVKIVERYHIIYSFDEEYLRILTIVDVRRAKKTNQLEMVVSLNEIA